LSPARSGSLFIGDLVTPPDERRGAVGSRHLIQAKEGRDGVGGGEVGEGRIAMKAAIANAGADPCRLGTAGHLDEAEFRAGKQGLERVEQRCKGDQLGKQRGEESELGDLADGAATALRSEGTVIPLGVVPHMLALQEDLVLAMRWEAVNAAGNAVHAFAQAR